jgi:hypothetical protein
MSYRKNPQSLMFYLMQPWMVTFQTVSRGTQGHIFMIKGLCPNYLSKFTFNTTMTTAMSQTGFIMAHVVMFYSPIYIYLQNN